MCPPRSLPYCFRYPSQGWVVAVLIQSPLCPSIRDLGLQRGNAGFRSAGLFTSGLSLLAAEGTQM